MISFNNAVYKKCDLHIHSPSSSCYSDLSVKPSQIVQAALDAGLDAIAITDHNTVRGMDEIQKAADNTKLSIFPGIELTTKSGHFLAIFDIKTPSFNLNNIINTLGISPEMQGDGALQLPGNTLDILRAVREAGGLVVAAHIERWPSGFLETKEPRSSKMALHADIYINALEITVAQNKEQWNMGLVRGYPKRYACIQGSDAHAPAEIGRRPFLLKTEIIDLQALKYAFRNWDNVIMFPNESEKS